MKLIFLMGMPYSGKTTLGSGLARKLEMDFVDLDLEIERITEKSISEIFENDGEAKFRVIESKTLKRVVSSPSSGTVISLGGGTPCFANNFEIIKSSGLSIFLNVDLEELIKRSEKDNKRPLLKGENRARKIQQMFEKRIECYKKADLVVSGNNLDIEALIDISKN